MDDKEIAETILDIYNSIREGALEDGDVPEEEIGVEVYYEQVLQGVRASDYDETNAMIESLGEAQTDEELEAIGDIFYDWMQHYVFKPLADEAIGQLVDRGLLECTGIGEDGEFVFHPTAKGIDTDDWNLEDFI